jgi:hypothetical protein
MNVVIPPPATLKTLLDTVVGPGIANPVPDNQFYQAIATWLSSPPMVTSINTPFSIPPTVFGTSVVNFPLMPIMGTVSFYSMLAAGAAGLFSDLASLNPLEAPFEILSNFIFAGFLANFITPVATTGIIGSAYSGMTFPFWLMLDCPDFPVGIACKTEVLAEMLSLFGMSDLSDESIIAKQQEILDNLVDQPVDNGKCSIIYNADTDSYTPDPSCDDEFINNVVSAGCDPDSDDSMCCIDSGNGIDSESFDVPIGEYLLGIPETSAISDTVFKTIPDDAREVIEDNPTTTSLFEGLPDETANACEDLLNNADIDNINTNYDNIDSNALATPVVVDGIQEAELEFANINISVLEPTVTGFFIQPEEPFEGIDPTRVVITNKS